MNSNIVNLILWGIIAVAGFLGLMILVEALPILSSIPDIFFVTMIFYSIFLLGIFPPLFLMPLVPKLIQLLTNNPNKNRPEDDPEKARNREYPVSTFGFFTELNPGQVKIIERGGRFVRCIMDYDEHKFDGEGSNNDLTPDDRAYWTVRETRVIAGAKEKESRPIPSMPLPWSGHDGIFLALVKLIFYPYRIVWWLWENWVYKITGFVFTGIYPFQQVRAYPIERFKKVKRGEDGGENGEEQVVRIVDYSDHFRVADFQFPITIPSADTQDKIPVMVRVDFFSRVYNAYSAAYDTDDWSSRLSAALGDVITHYTRPRPVSEVLSAETGERAREFAKEILLIGDEADIRKPITERKANTITAFGLIASQALISDISVVSADDRKKLGELARARVDSDAEAARAVGRASDIREQAKAIRENGHLGLAVLAASRDERVAKAAAGKGAIINIGTGGRDADPIQAAILHELRERSDKDGSTNSNGGTTP